MDTITRSGHEVREGFRTTCCRSVGLLALMLLTCSFSLANAQTWSGSGPFPPGAKSRTVHALAVDPATGRVYAGTGSGTVFAVRQSGMGARPVAVDDFAVTNPGVAVLIDVMANDFDPEGALWYENSEVSQPAHGTVTRTNAEPGYIAYTYTPDAGFVGTDSFEYDVADLAGNVAPDAVVTVRVNALPTAADDAASVLPNEPVTIDVLGNDADADGSLDPATVAISDPPANGSAIVEANGQITYAPAVDFTGTASFSYTVGDNDGGVSNAAAVTVTVNEPPNSPPSAANDAAVTEEGMSVTIAVLANDGDADGTLAPVTVTVQTPPGDGTATADSNGLITYTPAAGFTGTDSFTYTVEDDGGASSNAATVSVTVTAAGGGNTSPVASDDVASTGQGVAVDIAVLANDGDADGALDPATVTVQTGPGDGSANVNADGSVTYTPEAGFTGTDSFTYTVADDDGASSNAATVLVTVTANVPDNEPPTALDDAATTDEATPVTIDVLANDSDADGTLNPATVTVQAEPGEGSVAVNADGTITYTPDASFSGTDSFTYTVQDDDGAASGAATVQVTVIADIPNNEPPTVVDDTAATDEATPVTIDVLANDSDADGTLNPATVTVQAEPGEGSVAVNANGTITYTPDAAFSATDTFTYTVADDAGEASDAATVTVTVNAAGNPPSGGGGGDGGGGGGATGLLLLFATTFVLLLRRARNVERSR